MIIKGYEIIIKDCHLYFFKEDPRYIELEK